MSGSIGLPAESSLKLHDPRHVDALACVIYEIDSAKSGIDHLSWDDFSRENPAAAYEYYFLEAARVLTSAGLFLRAEDVR